MSRRSASPYAGSVISALAFRLCPEFALNMPGHLVLSLYRWPVLYHVFIAGDFWSPLPFVFGEEAHAMWPPSLLVLHCCAHGPAHLLGLPLPYRHLLDSIEAITVSHCFCAPPCNLGTLACGLEPPQLCIQFRVFVVVVIAVHPQGP